jgi:hypothetical protein
MKLPKELYNGIIIWIGISIYFLSMKALDCGFILSQSADSLFTMAQIEC